jgi:iron complex transport system ATP-binding protein
LSAAPAIEVHDVEAGYRPARAVLRGVSLQVQPGELLAIIGPNGSGKTTLLRVMAGVLQPWRGKVVIQGQPVAHWRRPKLARILAVVPQIAPVPFAFTVREYVALGRTPYLAPWQALRPADIEAVAHALAVTDLQHLADQPVTQLSGGELQRANLARALAQQPQILLLDEPTVFLDPAHSLAMLSLLQRLNRAGLTVVAVVHDLNLAAAFSRRVLALKAGRNFAQGTVEEVMTVPVLEELFGTPVQVQPGPDGQPTITFLKVQSGHAE